jgi:hypothetical protein
MRKTIATLFLAFLVTIFVTGCGDTGIGDAKTADYTHLEKTIPMKKMHALIMESAIEDGWRVTEFKENQLIAEKVQSDETVAVTVTFSENSFYISPKNSDLQETLEDRLEN